MKLSKLKLWNYRCFGSEEQVILIDQLTTFIGNNSAGKTAALSALNCMFSENSNDRILHRSDFHLPKDILPDEMEQQSLYIEAVFEFEELQSGSNGGEYAIPIFFQHFVVDNPGRLPYLRIRLEATWEKSNTIDGSIDSKISISDKSVQRASKDTCYQFQDGCCTEFERTRGKAMWHRYKR